MSACTDKVLALKIFKKIQEEEGLETVTEEGNYFLILLFSFIIQFSPPLPRIKFLFLFSGEDEALEAFSAEDQEAEIRWFKGSLAETQKLVQDTLQQDWGRGEVVHPKKAKELILKVIIFPKKI